MSDGGMHNNIEYYRTSV